MKDYLEGLKNGDPVSSVVVAAVTGIELEAIESLKPPANIQNRTPIDVIGKHPVYETFTKASPVAPWQYCGHCWTDTAENKDATLSKIIYIYSDLEYDEKGFRAIEKEVHKVVNYGDIPINLEYSLPLTSLLTKNLELKESIEKNILEFCDNVVIICKDGAKHSKKCTEIIEYCLNRKLKYPRFRVVN